MRVGGMLNEDTLNIASDGTVGKVVVVMEDGTSEGGGEG